MKAIAITQFGDVDAFKIIELEKPTVKPGHVLIKVEATSVNPLDFKLRKGFFPDLVPSFPMILHGDVAGVVVDVGEGVCDFKVNDEVYGCAGGLLAMQGALAEWMLVDAHLIAHKPKSVSFMEAAALPLVSLTAWEALITKANVQKNQSVLIHGGTGGVGHIALQLAKSLGAKVFTSHSEEHKAILAKQLGTDITINYKTMQPEQYVEKYTENRGFDVIFDTVGGDNIHQCIKAAALYGQIVSILPCGTLETGAAFLKALTLHFVLQPLPLITGMNRTHYGEILRKIAAMVDCGIIKPLIDKHAFTMQDVAAAHDHLEKGRAIGKVVMRGF